MKSFGIIITIIFLASIVNAASNVHSSSNQTLNLAVKMMGNFETAGSLINALEIGASREDIGFLENLKVDVGNNQLSVLKVFNDTLYIADLNETLHVIDIKNGKFQIGDSRFEINLRLSFRENITRIDRALNSKKIIGLYGMFLPEAQAASLKNGTAAIGIFVVSGLYGVLGATGEGLTGDNSHESSAHAMSVFAVNSLAAYAREGAKPLVPSSGKCQTGKDFSLYSLRYGDGTNLYLKENTDGVSYSKDEKIWTKLDSMKPALLGANCSGYSMVERSQSVTPSAPARAN